MGAKKADKKGKGGDNKGRRRARSENSSDDLSTQLQLGTEQDNSLSGFAAWPDSDIGEAIALAKTLLTRVSDDPTLEKIKNVVNLFPDFVVTQHKLEQYKKITLGIKQIPNKDAFDKLLEKLKGHCRTV